MDETARRPGGLTALAVFNFIFGAFFAFGALGLAIVLFAPDSMLEQMKPEEREQIRDPQIRSMARWMLPLEVVGAGLLISSGVGYLQQKRWGRWLGNLGAAIGLGVVAVGVAHSQFDIGTIIGAIYPVLTLVLLNTTFRDDFHR